MSSGGHRQLSHPSVVHVHALSGSDYLLSLLAPALVASCCPPPAASRTAAMTSSKSAATSKIEQNFQGTSAQKTRTRHVRNTRACGGGNRGCEREGEREEEREGGREGDKNGAAAGQGREGEGDQRARLGRGRSAGRQPQCPRTQTYPPAPPPPHASAPSSSSTGRRMDDSAREKRRRGEGRDEDGSAWDKEAQRKTTEQKSVAEGAPGGRPG